MSKDTIRTARVKDIMHVLSIAPAALHKNAGIRDMLAKIIEDPQSRHVYVVDDDNRLLGSIRLNAVVEYIFPFEIFGTENLWSEYFGSFYKEHVTDFINPATRAVTEETPLSEMVRIMHSEKVNELPVVDPDNRLIGEVNILKAIKYYLSLGTEV